VLNKITEKKVDENVRFSKVTFNWTFARKQRNWELKVFNLKFVKKSKNKSKISLCFFFFLFISSYSSARDYDTTSTEQKTVFFIF
jgi:hypothetical protein